MLGRDMWAIRSGSHSVRQGIARFLSFLNSMFDRKRMFLTRVLKFWILIKHVIGLFCNMYTVSFVSFFCMLKLSRVSYQTHTVSRKQPPPKKNLKTQNKKDAKQYYVIGHWKDILIIQLNIGLKAKELYHTKKHTDIQLQRKHSTLHYRESAKWLFIS